MNLCSMRRCGAGTNAGHRRCFHEVPELIPWLFEGFGPEHRSGMFEMAGGAKQVALCQFSVDALPSPGKDPMRNLLGGISVVEFESVSATATLASVTTRVERFSATCGHPLALVGELN